MMRNLLVVVAALALVSCGVQNVNSTSSLPVTISRAIGVADSAYIAAYTAGAARVHEGKMSRADFITWEAVAYNAVLLIRTAQTLTDLQAAQRQLADAAAKLNP